MTRVIVLLHGFGTGPYALWPLSWYLRWKLGKQQAIVIPKYDTSGITSMAVLLQRVSGALQAALQAAGLAHARLVVVGQSLGGIAAMNLWSRGWDVRHAVSVGSPLRGARFVSTVRVHVPLAAMLMRDATYTFLETPKEQPEPPHPFHTISCGLFHTPFDGCVHRDEATLDNARHTHERNLHHSLGWVTPQLWQSVWAVLQPEFAPTPSL